MTKAERLREMERLYVQRAYTDMEMAERLGADRATIYRHRIELEAEYPIVEVEPGKYRIDRSRYLSGIKVNLHEALALYLAARRASRQTRIAQVHAANALEKLASALKQPMTERLVKAAGAILQQQAQPERVDVLEKIAQGWVEQRKVLIDYRALRSKQMRQHLICPYLIEPSLWSDGVYVIGLEEALNKVMTFKVERIENAELKLATFTIPETFDDADLLRHAWGIWFGEDEPSTVRLRFAPGRATTRLRESIWHPQQKPLVELEDGGVIWEAPVAEWQEMLPWVRGWGAEVEVLAPEELRQAVIKDVRRMALRYSLQETCNGSRFYAHSNQASQTNWQLIKEHLENTADLAVELGSDAGLAEFARLAAYLHDIGKYSQAFQRKLLGEQIKVDHSTAGAQEIMQLFQRNPTQSLMATLLAYCIAGHHNGLPDYGSEIDCAADGTLKARLKKTVEDYQAYQQEINATELSLPDRLPIQAARNAKFSMAFFTRMLYSALVDADYQETETFMHGGKKLRGEYAEIAALCDRFNHFLERFENPVGAINQQRTKTLHACIANASEPPGFFTLTVPTGGGKTFASMAFALNHAVQHGLKRVIFVIPYTSIIEQNAAEFKKCLGDENVLEHHSNFEWTPANASAEAALSDDQTNTILGKLKLAAENWDIPIVVTTNVQFFESLYANRSSRCRKLHNMAKSVIIFDEAQMLPREYMQPCLYAVYELVKNYGASAVFCTATQPAVEQFLPKGTKLQELAPDPQALFDFYKRVQVKSIGKTLDAEIIQQMNERQQVLCIVNTRKHARGLFESLTGEGRFHLSTFMCPAHRRDTIGHIKDRLKQRESCRVVSTQIMEAGIDVDFPVGYRAIAGLDSIIQAAGRVNREGRQQRGELLVFDPDSAFVKRVPAYIRQGADVAQSILRDFKGDPVCMQAIQSYFTQLYVLQDPKAFDARSILECFEKKNNAPDFDFKTAAEKFRLIEENTAAVIIPYNKDAVQLLQEVRRSSYPAAYARKLQIYTVNIYEREYQALLAMGLIDFYADRYAVLNHMDYYHDQTGLQIPESEGGEAIFFDG